MNDFKFDTLDDIKKSIADFYKIPIRSRFIISNKIHSRLKELDEYVKVSKDNPILNYPSERFIVDDKYEDNEYLVDHLIEVVKDEGINILEELQAYEDKYFLEFLQHSS